MRNGTQPASDIDQARCLSWVKLTRTQYEHMFSALPPNSDIARRSRHVSNVPLPDSSPIDDLLDAQEQSCGIPIGRRLLWKEAINMQLPFLKRIVAFEAHDLRT